MPEISKARNRVRYALKNAAIYGALAEISDDRERARDFGRLREIEVSLARRWSETISYEFDTRRGGRFSISLALLKLGTRIFNSRRISGLLRNRFRRRLSAHVDDYLTEDASNHAAESMTLLDRLSGEAGSEVEHVEQGSIATRSGALRAMVLGVNDGIVSNTSLILGVAAGASDPNVVILAGAAGLLGGALSMAAGEYVSVVSQREFNENLVRWERAELLLWKDEEEAELVDILESKGLSEAEARSAAARIMSDPQVALDVHVREELGIDPDDLGGSPTVAATSSFVAFAVGAGVPLMPFIVSSDGTTTVVASALGAAAALFFVGGSLGWLSGNHPVFGALRMLAVGLISGALTYGLGYLVGQQIG